MSDILKNFVTAMDVFIASKSALVTAFGTRYGLNRMEQDSAFPYLVYTWVNNISDRDSINEWENPLIEFAIFSDDNAPTEIMDLTKTVMDNFDDAELSVSGFSTVKFRRTNDFFAPAGAESRRFWDKRIRYETEYQKT